MGKVSYEGLRQATWTYKVFCSKARELWCGVDRKFRFGGVFKHRNVVPGIRN